MATWPSTLPQKPLYSGFSETFANTGIRTSMDVGPPKTRRRTTAGVGPHEVTFYLESSTQLGYLRTFYGSTLGSGTLPFDWAHPITGVTESWLFTGPPKITPEGLWYLASFGLEVQP